MTKKEPKLALARIEGMVAAVTLGDLAVRPGTQHLSPETMAWDAGYCSAMVAIMTAPKFEWTTAPPVVPGLYVARTKHYRDKDEVVMAVVSEFRFNPCSDNPHLGPGLYCRHYASANTNSTMGNPMGIPMEDLFSRWALVVPQVGQDPTTCAIIQDPKPLQVDDKKASTTGP